MRKKRFAEFVPNFEVEKVKKFGHSSISRFLKLKQKPQGGAPPQW